MKTVQNLGFSCRIEDINAVEAWRGSLPGDAYCNVRRVLLHTLNLADMLPITSVWAGLRENPSALMPKNSPALLYAATSGATPFRFNLHVSDLGHTLIVGPPGAGKSTAVGLIAAQWFRYPSAADTASAAVRREMSQTGAMITRRNLNIQPTIMVPAGNKFSVRVNRDILFDSPYQPVEANPLPVQPPGQLNRRTGFSTTGYGPNR